VGLFLFLLCGLCTGRWSVALPWVRWVVGIAWVLPCVSRWSSASIFVFDEVVGGWGEDGGALVIKDQRRKSWVGALVSRKPNQRREKTKERETLMEERENEGWS
jgi:hypothetical protein